MISDSVLEVIYKLRRCSISVYEYDLNSYDLNSNDYPDDIYLELVDNFYKVKGYLKVVKCAFKLSFLYYCGCAIDTLWEMLFDSKMKNYLIVDNNAVVIGTVSLAKSVINGNANSFVLSNFAISSKLRGKKLSYGAMNSILKFAKVSGYRYIRLKVKKVNVPALKVYSALGFIEVGEM